MKPDTNTHKFKFALLSAEVTQTKLAEEFGVSKQTFNGWVTGRITPPLNTALRIAARLDVTVEELWTYKEG